MATLTIRRVPEETKQRLRMRAAANNRSMEEEIRRILEDAARVPQSSQNFYQLVRSIVGEEGIELDIPPRTDMPRHAFEGWDDEE